MVYLNKVVKRAAADQRWSSLYSAAATRPTVPALRSVRTFASEDNFKKDDVPRTPTGEVQKQNNFASGVGKKMQEVAPGGDPAKSSSSGKGEQPKQERDKGGGVQLDENL